MGMIVGHRVRDELFWFVERIDKDIKKLGKGLEKSEKSLKRKTKLGKTKNKKALRKQQIKFKRRIQNDLKELRKILK